MKQLKLSEPGPPVDDGRNQVAGIGGSIKDKCRPLTGAMWKLWTILHVIIRLAGNVVKVQVRHGWLNLAVAENVGRDYSYNLSGA